MVWFCWLQALSKALPDDALLYLTAQFRLLEPKDGCVSLSNFKTVSSWFYQFLTSFQLSQAFRDLFFN